MKKKFRIIGIGLITLFIIIQFFHPDKYNSAIDPAGDLIQFASPPDQVATLLKNACYDCHSNQTVYPWYGRISPASWYMDRHISKGREKMNLSEYGNTEKSDGIGLLVKICEEVEDGSMPLKSYRLLHKKARLTQEERSLICDWTEKEAMKIIRGRPVETEE
jgi:hypothetical protein